MTLLLTISAPDALIMCADSALTSRENGELVTLAGFPKIAYVPDRHMGISYTGGAKVGESWIHNWISSFCDDIAESEDPEDFAAELASTLNAIGVEGPLAFQLGTWVATGTPEYLLPIVWEVSNADGIDFKANSLLAPDFHQLVEKWQTDKSSYPFRVHSAGVPKQYSQWIARMLPEYSKLIDSPVPFPNAESLVRLAQFLVRQICDLLVIADKPNIVAAPILTRVLLPKPTLLVSDYR